MESREVRLRALQEEVSGIKSLLEHSGWKWLDNVAAQQIENRMPRLLQKMENLLSITEVEYEKGEVSGIYLFRQLPGITIESLEQEIRELEENIENDYRSGTASGSGSSGGDAERTSGGSTDDGDYVPAV